MFHRRVALPCVLCAALGAAPAHAEDRATAQQLFQQGKELIAAGKTADACVKFAAAAELSQTAGVRLNLADCYERLGRTASAFTVYDDALTVAERAGDSVAANLARARQAALKPKLSYLTIVVSKDAGAIEGLDLQRDGKPVLRAAWGTPVPVDPGDHDVRASAPHRKTWTIRAMSAPSTRNELIVPVLVEEGTSEPLPPPSVPPTSPQNPAAPSANGATPTPSAPPTPPASTDPSAQAGFFGGTGGTQRALAVAAAGVGIVGLGVGSIFGAQMLSKKSDYQKLESPDGRCIDMDCQTISHDAASAGNVASIVVIAGGALVAAGAVLFFTAPSREKSPTAGFVTVSPVVGLHGGGVGVGGAF